MENKSNGLMDVSNRSKSSMKNGTDEGEHEIDDHSAEIVELNHRMKTDFMSYCFSFLHDDEEGRECIQIVWNKYLQCVGDVATISTFFDTLPFNVKLSVLEKYQNEILDWCRHLLHINCQAILYAIHYNETFARVIRYALKLSTKKRSNSSPHASRKAIIYVSIDFDTQLKTELLTSIPFIQFEHVPNEVLREDMIDVHQLEQIIKRDLNDQQSYPFMVIAHAGTTLLGRCDELTKIKQFCQEYNLWLHVIGDLVGSLGLLSTIKEDVSINCDSLTMDAVKLFGIQNLPYLTFFLRIIPKIRDSSQTESNSLDKERSSIDNQSTISTNISSSSSSSTGTTTNANHISELPPLLDLVLHNPSIGFLSIWSISQRCSKSNVLYHMKCSFNLSNLLMKRLTQIKTLRILNDDSYQQSNQFTYKRICSGDAPDESLPKTVVLFRFETLNVSEIDKLDDIDGYIDLLNLWLFDKLSQKYPKMNFELLKSVHFQTVRSNDINRQPAHAIRFAPLEHLLDVIDEREMSSFCDDMQHYNDILLATMIARARLPSALTLYENLVPVPVPHWAGIGAVRYIPRQDDVDGSKEVSADDINTIQAELARKLQNNDSAFSLGGGIAEQESTFYLRLGMIQKQDDLDILLQKIAEQGKETEISLKYVEDMAEKIKAGIEKAQEDLQNENRQILAQEGLLRQLPVISNIMSWWSPSPTSSPLATKGRSFDLNSGRVESTENTYVYRMQIERQSSHAPTHEENRINSSSSTETDREINQSNDNIVDEQKDNS